MSSKFSWHHVFNDSLMSYLTQTFKSKCAYLDEAQMNMAYGFLMFKSLQWNSLWVMLMLYNFVAHKPRLCLSWQALMFTKILLLILDSLALGNVFGRKNHLMHFPHQEFSPILIVCWPWQDLGEEIWFWVKRFGSFFCIFLFSISLVNLCVRSPPLSIPYHSFIFM